MLDGVVLTVTDLAHRTKHVNWSAEAEVADGTQERVPISGMPLRRNEILLDQYFAVGEQARTFDVPPHLLRDHFRSGALDRSLVDGRVSLSNPDRTVAGYLREAARGRPGGRLIVLARPEPDPPVDTLFRCVIGLGLTAVVQVRTAKLDLRPPGVPSWRIRLQPASETDLTRARGWFGYSLSLPAAVALPATELDPALRQALEVGKLEPIRVPQQTTPLPAVDAALIESVLEGLSEVFPGTEIWLGVNLTSWSLVIGRPHDRAATASSLNQVLATMLAPELVTPEPDDLRRLLRLLLDKHTPDDQLDAEMHTVQGRFRFGLILTSLLRCVVTERFGDQPETGEIERLADRLHREARENPDLHDGSPPEPAAYLEVLASVTEPSWPRWHQAVSMSWLSAAMQSLGSLLRDRRNSGEDFTGIIEQAVEAGMLMARTVTESVERREQ